MKKITRVNLKFIRPLFTKNPPEIKKMCFFIKSTSSYF